jgi:hypothetical protein
MKYFEMRNMHYENQFSDVLKISGIDLNSWRNNPYTFLKARYFLELSCIIVYFLQKTTISPNTISLLTAFSGVFGGILLLFPTDKLYILGLFFFFHGYVFDWCDGLLARVTNQTSLTGKIFDPWGSHVFALCFRLSFGFYLALHTSEIFFFLAPFVLFFIAIDIKTFFQSSLFFELTTESIKLKDKSKKLAYYDKDYHHKQSDDVKLFVGKYYKYIKNISLLPDDRARTVDFICLLILVEQHFNLHVSWFIFILMIIKDSCRFFVHLGLIKSGLWVDSKVFENN